MNARVIVCSPRSVDTLPSLCRQIPNIWVQGAEGALDPYKISHTSFSRNFLRAITYLVAWSAEYTQFMRIHAKKSMGNVPPSAAMYYLPTPSPTLLPSCDPQTQTLNGRCSPPTRRTATICGSTRPHGTRSVCTHQRILMSPPSCRAASQNHSNGHTTPSPTLPGPPERANPS